MLGRLVTGLVLVATLTSACASLERRRDVAATPEGTVSVGQGLEDRLPKAGRGASGDSAPVFVLRLTDENGLHPQGIPVRVEGAQDRTALSDARGEVKVFEPGTYKVRVVTGCHQVVQVLGGGSATVGVAAGSNSTRDLPVQWRHRYGPSAPVFADPSERWKVGENAQVRYDVIDRCNEKRAPGSGFPTYTFRTSQILEVVGTPVLRADTDGRAFVAVVCRDAGNPELIVSDGRNPRDSLNLVREAVAYGGPPHCVR